MRDYDALFAEHRHALGEPAKEFSAYFENLSGMKTVLGIGCGQGRDALMIARLGHQVTAVDLSSSAINQLSEDARKEALAINAICADIREYQAEGIYDILLIDRSLHMLNQSEAARVL